MVEPPWTTRPAAKFCAAARIIASGPAA